MHTLTVVMYWAARAQDHALDTAVTALLPELPKALAAITAPIDAVVGSLASN